MTQDKSFPQMKENYLRVLMKENVLRPLIKENEPCPLKENERFPLIKENVTSVTALFLSEY